MPPTAPIDVPTPAAPTPAPQVTGGVNWSQFHTTGTAGAATTLTGFVDQILGWMKEWGGYLAGFAILAVALLMILGFRHRSEVARKALEGLPFIFAGALLIGSAASLVAALV